MKKLMIFDLDGTLFDTNYVNYFSYNEALKLENFELNYSDFVKKCSGKNYKDFLPIIINNCDREVIERIHDYKKSVYKKYLKYARENKNLFDIIQNCRNDYYIVIVTTASKSNTIDILKYFNREKIFDDIITKEDYNETKPSPECFIHIMKKYNMNCENVIIFEDSDIGIDAAMKSGANVIKIEKF